jgi:hypothetical protein
MLAWEEQVGTAIAVEIGDNDLASQGDAFAGGGDRMPGELQSGSVPTKKS